MQQLLYKTKSGGSPQDKPRVYFTCHPDDFDRTFSKICEDIFKTHDCAIYYTENMTELLPEDTREFDLERMNLFVVPVTFRLMTTPNRANDYDLKFAKEREMLILPILFEPGIDSIYSLPENFGNRQYLAPFGQDPTAISYEEKLKKYLESTLFDDKTVERIRKAFDAYIFLSYRKMDRVYANDLMKLIHSEPKFRDLAIWYDEFLTPGEDFNTEIDNALSLSKLFAIAVTPNLAKYTPEGNPNYIMTVEYPMAKDSVLDQQTGEKLPIVPVQVADMGEKDWKTLSKSKEFSDIPEVVDGRKLLTLSEAMYVNLKHVALQENADKPEHNYLIGLAYLNGIDVEVNTERGLNLIKLAAESELPEAMEKLADMYHNGIAVQRNYKTELFWRKALYDYYKKHLGEEHQDTLISMRNWVELYGEYNLEDSSPIKDELFELCCKVLGEKHPDTLIAESNMAITDGKLWGPKTELLFQEEVYKARCEVLGEDHPSTLETRNRLYLIFKKIIAEDSPSELTDFIEKMLTFQQDCFVRCKQALGLGHPETIKAVSNLADIYRILGNYSEALKLEKTVCVARSKLLEVDHPDTLSSMSNIATLYCLCGDYNLAIKTEKQVLAIRNVVLGINHPETLLSICNIASIYYHSGNIEMSLFSIDRLIDICKENHFAIPHNVIDEVSTIYCALGEENPDTLFCLSTLALTCSELGDHEYVATILERLYSIRCKVLGEEHPNTLETMRDLAASYSRLGDHEREAEVYEKLYAIQSKVLGEEHPDTIKTLKHMAFSYSDLGEYKHKAEVYEKLYAMCCKLLGKEDSSSLWMLNNLALSYSELGDHRQEAEQFEKLYTTRCSILGEEHPDTLACLDKVVAAYCKLGAFRNAYELGEKVYALRCKVSGEDRLDTLTSLSKLVAICSKLGNYKRAYDLQEKAYALHCLVFGEKHEKTLHMLSNLAVASYNSHDPERALKCCDKIAEVDTILPPSIIKNISELYVRLGYPEKASQLQKDIK